jgi:hypothetical protein
MFLHMVIVHTLPTHTMGSLPSSAAVLPIVLHSQSALLLAHVDGGVTATQNIQDVKTL